MNYGILFIVILSSFLMISFAQYLLGSSLQKLFIFGGVFGIYFYCSIGTAYPGVEPSYTLFYIFIFVSYFQLHGSLVKRTGLVPLKYNISTKES